MAPIYSSRGAMLVVMPTGRNGVKDLVSGGPGFEHPLYQWNGTTYSQTRTVPDSATSNGLYLPPG